MCNIFVSKKNYQTKCFSCGLRPAALSRPCWLLPKSNSLNISFPAGLCHKPLWWKPDYFDLNVFPQLVVMEWVTPPGNHLWFLLRKNYKSLPKILWFPFSFHQVYEKLDHLFSSVTKCQHIQTYILIVTRFCFMRISFSSHVHFLLHSLFYTIFSAFRNSAFV